MIHCPSCGATNQEDKKFCDKCGYTLSTGENTRCPMCSADNPVGTVFCHKCEARLVPISAPLPESPEEAPPTPIKGLSLPSKPIPEEETETTEETAASPEDEKEKEKALRWLRRLGRMQGDENIVEAAAAWQPEEEAPDWLQALRRKYPEDVPLKDRPAPPPEPTAATSPEEEEEDWLQKLRVATLEEDEEAPLPGPQPLEQPEEELDWLERLRAGTLEETEDQDTGLPEGLRAEGPPEEAADWLSELRIGLAEETPPVEEEETAPPTETAEEVPDWLRDLRPAAREEEVAAIPTEAAPPTEAEEEVPDWLRGLQLPAEEEEGIPPIRVEEAAPLETEEPTVPEWIEGLRRALPEEGPPTAPEVEVPDWIEGLGPVSETAEAPPEPQEEVPDELKDLRPTAIEAAPTAEEPKAIPPIEPAAEGDEVPDWLRELSEAASFTKEEPQAVLLSPDEEPEALEIEKPAWLREIGPPEEETLTRIEVEADKAALPDEAVRGEPPDWLKDIEPTTEEAAAPVLAQEGPAVLLGEEELALAEIPDWLQALRPTEGAEAAAAAALEVVETSGPLAGIRGVLPVEPLISEPRGTTTVAPPPPTVDKRRAAVFKAVIAGPPPAPITRRKRRRTGLLARVVRWSVHVFLLLAVLAPVLLGTRWFTAANVSEGSDGSRAFFATVQSLPADSTVLMAYDYDPATAAEMNLQAEAIVHHLMSRNLKLVAVSLLPAGPAVAQDIMERAATAHAGYLYRERYLNLGYLPGQEAAVRDLAQNPMAVLKADYLNRESLTDIPLAQDVARVEDLDLIVEMASSQDSLKWWIEQIGSQHDVPIVSGVSASVEPYARPYYGSGQLVGLVSGLVGAAEYEALTQRPASAIDSLDPQAAAHLALLVLIIVGNVTYLLTRRRERS